MNVIVPLKEQKDPHEQIWIGANAVYVQFIWNSVRIKKYSNVSSIQKRKSGSLLHVFLLYARFSFYFFFPFLIDKLISYIAQVHLEVYTSIFFNAPFLLL